MADTIASDQERDPEEIEVAAMQSQSQEQAASTQTTSAQPASSDATEGRQDAEASSYTPDQLRQMEAAARFVERIQMRDPEAVEAVLTYLGVRSPVSSAAQRTAQPAEEQVDQGADDTTSITEALKREQEAVARRYGLEASDPVVQALVDTQVQVRELKKVLKEIRETEAKRLEVQAQNDLNRDLSSLVKALTDAGAPRAFAERVATGEVAYRLALRQNGSTVPSLEQSVSALTEGVRALANMQRELYRKESLQRSEQQTETPGGTQGVPTKERPLPWDPEYQKWLADPKNSEAWLSQILGSPARG